MTNNHRSLQPVRTLAAICLALGVLISFHPAFASPPVTTNLKLQLDAGSLALSEGDPVALWLDGSPEGNNASQGTLANQPTYHASLINGQPALTFDGAGDSFSLINYGTHALNTVPLTYFAIFRTTSALDGSLFPGNPIVSDNTSGIGLSFGVDNGVGLYTQYNGSGHSQFAGATPVNNGQVHLLTLVDPNYNANPSATVSMYRDGALDGSFAGTYAAFRSYNAIGSGFGSPATFSGDIAEILIYHGTLSDIDRQSVENYLMEKYSVPEPASLTLAALGALALVRRTKRTRRV